VNTPLTGISSFTQMLLQNAEPDDPRTRLLEKIERQTFRAAKIVNGLLSLSRPASATSSERVIVVYDDVSLSPGRIRVRAKGSDGGHNGIKDIIYQMKSDAFPRVKIGVGMPDNPGYDLADWVLSRFPEDEKKLIRGSVERAANAVLAIISSGAESDMNSFNG
jgi:hypothetical protein